MVPPAAAVSEPPDLSSSSAAAPSAVSASASPAPAEPHLSFAATSPPSSDGSSRPTGKPKAKRAWLWPAVAAIAGLIVGYALAPKGGTAQGVASPQAEASLGSQLTQAQASIEALTQDKQTLQGSVDALTKENETLKSAAKDKASSPSASPKAQDGQQIAGDGVFVVGQDVKAGEYKTAGPAPGVIELCYYAIKNGTDSDAQILSNKALKGQGRVTLKKGQVFETQGCQEWNRT